MSLKFSLTRAWKWTIVAILAMGILSPFLLSGMVCLAVSDAVQTERKADGQYDVILILGCGVKENGEPSDMLADRLKTGISLYEQGAAPRMLLSGDHEYDDYNEIAVMKQFCLEAGVPEDAILCDRYGLSTYDSMIRAAAVYEIDRAVIVTQRYHLYRALYLAEKMGMESIGVDADLRNYRLQGYRSLREVLARCKDFYMIQRGTLPQYAVMG